MSIDLLRKGHTAVVVLNRPEKHNAITPGMRAELQDAWREVSADPEIRAVVVTGAGSRAFCAGNDLGVVPTDTTKADTPGADTAFAVEAFGRDGDDSLFKGLDPDLPTVAAVNGYAIGGGMEIALHCDIRIASSRAEFALTEARIGSIPGAGGTQLLPRMVGRSLALQMLLTGERISADRAQHAGLVSEVTRPEALMERAEALAAKIAESAPLSVRAIKRLTRFGEDAPLSAALAAERMAFGLLRSTSDRREGRAAFVEGRPPHYEGR